MYLKLFRSFHLLYFVILIFFIGCGRDGLRYTSFEGDSSTLIFLNSKEVLLLYPFGFYNDDSLSLLLKTYDKAYSIAGEILSQEPSLSFQRTDKVPLAIIPKTCGAGCGRLGQKGIEIEKQTFDTIYKEFVLNGNQDHLFFYELGRNFWFYGDRSEDVEWEAIHTGFAVFFRDMLIRELKISIAPINQIPYEEYLEHKQNLWNRFRKNCQDNGFNTWEEVQQIRYLYFSNSPVFWSSMWWDLYQKKGRQGVSFSFEKLRKSEIPKTGKAWFDFFSK